MRLPPGGVQPSTMSSSRPRHLTFTQPCPRPARYGASACLQMMPSRPSRHASHACRRRRQHDGRCIAAYRASPQARQHALAIDQLAWPQVPAVEMQQIEQIEVERCVLAGGKRGLQCGKTRHPVWSSATSSPSSNAVSTRSLPISRATAGSRSVQSKPVARHHAHLAVVDPAQQAITVKFDLADPAFAFRRFLRHRGQLRRLPLRQLAAHRTIRRRRRRCLARCDLRAGFAAPRPRSSAVASSPARSASSCPLINSQLSCRPRCSGRGFSRTSVKRPCSRLPCRTNLSSPLRIPASGSSSGSQVPRSQVSTLPAPYWPSGMVPWKSA